MTRDALEAMHESSDSLSAAVGEFDVFEIEREPTEMVASSCVASSAVHFKSTLERSISFDPHTMFVGAVEYVHVREEVTTPDGKPDVDRIDGIDRLTSVLYVHLDDRIRRGPVTNGDFDESRRASLLRSSIG